LAYSLFFHSTFLIRCFVIRSYSFAVLTWNPCNGPEGKRDKPSEKLGYTFRCKAKGCGKTLSPLANTIFERSKLPLLTILTAVYWFVNEVTRAQASSFLKVSEPSITALWKKLCLWSIRFLEPNWW
jgi:hypothetical protein